MSSPTRNLIDFMDLLLDTVFVVNTDNRLITDTTVSKELHLVHTKMGVPFREIKSMIVAGFKSAFRPFHEKQAALRHVVSELSRYDDEGNLVDAPVKESKRPRASAELSSPPASAPTAKA